MPESKLPPELLKRESALRNDPTSEWRHSQVLSAYFTEELQAHPRRIEHIAAYVRRFPRTPLARCPIAHVSKEVSPVAFVQVHREWQAQVDAHPDDSEITRGLAMFLVESDREAAQALLEDAARNWPDDAEVWTDLGNVSVSHSRRLVCFQRALELGSSQPNLLVWTGRAAIQCDDLVEAERIGTTLLERAREARAIQDRRIDWDDTGVGAWQRLRAVVEDAPDRARLVDLVSGHANDKHWGNTILGVVASRRGHTRAASRHLRESANVVGEPRLSSYGPSFLLAEALCKDGQWDSVESYLQACKAFWDIETLDAWITDVRAEQIPEFEED